ncbi:MAG TPA: oxygenase MpaB family protein [Acidimicrobiia bacterium]|nr:oxygenase MpaB family protein [Acidimicrobiia bacterium]
MAFWRNQSAEISPQEDYGFFGPGSVTWKVWSYPTSLTVGFQRAVVIEELDPALVASVEATRAIWDRPRSRYDRTIRYFALVAFGDSRSATEASDVLVKVHAKGVGTEPYSGEHYDANDPRSQLWILLTAWHSVLYAYERFGPGKLTAEEEEQYWNECAIAAELQTCDPADVPRSRQGVRRYFEEMRPSLSGSELARRTMAHLLTASVLLPPVPLVVRPAAWAVSGALRSATIATMPRWMREMAALRQSRLVDSLIVPFMKVAFGVSARSTALQLEVLRRISPSTVPVAGPALLGMPARNPETTTPATARHRLRLAKPGEAHLDFRARQRASVFDEGVAPSDDGLVESEPILGSIA